MPSAHVDEPGLRAASTPLSTLPAARPAAPASASVAVDWDALVQRYSPGLASFLVRRTRRLTRLAGPDFAAETEQETWCRVFSRGGSRLREALARGESSTRAYLVLVASRVLLDRLRKLRAAKRGRALLSPAAGTTAYRALRRSEPFWDPELRLLLNEGRREFVRQCDRITRRSHRSDLRQRNARILRRALLEGWTSLEIVDGERELGVPIAASSVDTMISRARSSFARAGWRLPDRRRRGPA